jgi:hypothetical protein
MAKTKRDLLTIAYDEGGAMFRRSPYGMALRFAITNDLTKTARDKLLSKFPEHQKRLAQYLTGGTVSNKEITQLPENIKKEVIKAHQLDQYPDRKEFYTKGSKKGEPNPKYNPRSNLLSTWNEGYDENYRPQISKETTYSLGHVQFIPDGKGGYTMTDVYDVDPNEELGDKTYKPITGNVSDLVEGDIEKGQRINILGRQFKAPFDIPVASRAYDISNFLGINKPMKFNVKFNRKDLQINQ